MDVDVASNDIVLCKRTLDPVVADKTTVDLRAKRDTRYESSPHNMHYVNKMNCGD